MRFWRDPAAPLVTVRWYFVPESRPALPFDSVFTSRNWEPYPVGWDQLGEVEGEPRPWRDGSTVGDAPGVRACGTAEQWIAGEALPPSDQVLDAAGTPSCCFPSAFVPFTVLSPCCPNPVPANLNFLFTAGAQVVPLVYTMADAYWHALVLPDPVVPRPVEVRMGCKPAPGGGQRVWQLDCRFQGDAEWVPPGAVNFPICEPFLWGGRTDLGGLELFWDAFE